MKSEKLLIHNGQLTKDNCINFYWWLRKWCCWLKGMSINKKCLLVYILLMVMCYVPNIAKAAVDGWIKEGDVWKYEEKGVFKTGWIKYKDKWFFLDEAGVMKNGWVKVQDKWYFLNEAGEMVSGWIEHKDKWYYLSDNGSMATGWISYNNQWYYLNPEGDMAINTYVDGYWIDGDGVRKDSATEVNNGSKKVPKIVEEKSLNSTDVGLYDDDNNLVAVILKLDIKNIDELVFSNGRIKDISYITKDKTKVYFTKAEVFSKDRDYMKVKFTLENKIMSGLEEGSVVSNGGSSTKIHDNIKPTFRIIKVEDKDGNGCVDEVAIRFNKEVAINNVLNFHLEGGGKASTCSSFYCDGINATLRFDYFTYGEGNNVPINASDIRLINKNTEALTIYEGPWARKPNTDMNGNVMGEGYVAYYR